MIKYALNCENEHLFESWFQSANAFDKLMASGHVNCSICGSTGVSKSIMAPSITSKKKSVGSQQKNTPKNPLSSPSTLAEQAIKELRTKIEKNSENVGKNFAREARKIHAGDVKERSIYGEANIQDAKALMEDGIPVVPLPFAPNRKLN